jgi:mono/diheme cytochrome c family protein
MSRSCLLLMACLALALVVAVPAGVSSQTGVEQGIKAYADAKCIMCHSIAGKGNAKGPLDEVGKKLTAAQLREWLTDPVGMSKKANATRMPPMKFAKPLPTAQVDALVAYLETLKGK